MNPPRLTDTLSLVDMPPIPGLSFRRFRGAADYPAMVAILEGCKEADSVERVCTIEEIALQYTHLANCNPVADMIFAEVGGAVIGYGRVTWWQEADRKRLYWHTGWTLPAWRRRGIGRAMLRWQERRLQDIAAGHPDDGPRWLVSHAEDTEIAKSALLASEGYQPYETLATMLRPDLEDIPDAPLPLGFEVRPATPEHYRLSWEADLNAFRHRPDFSDPGEEGYQAWLADPRFQPDLWQVAWHVETDVIAGQVRPFIDRAENEAYGRQRGYTEDISVQAPFRRRGLARALLCRSLRLLKERGMTEAALGVNLDNPDSPHRVYEGVGFRIIKMLARYRKPMG